MPSALAVGAGGAAGPSREEVAAHVGMRQREDVEAEERRRRAADEAQQRQAALEKQRLEKEAEEKRRVDLE